MQSWPIIQKVANESNGIWKKTMETSQAIEISFHWPLMSLGKLPFMFLLVKHCIWDIYWFPFKIIIIIIVVYNIMHWRNDGLHCGRLNSWSLNKVKWIFWRTWANGYLHVYSQLRRNLFSRIWGMVCHASTIFKHWISLSNMRLNGKKFIHILTLVIQF